MTEASQRALGQVAIVYNESEWLWEVNASPGVGDEFPVRIGQIPLELLDWVVDPKGQRLVGNPEHGGEHITEVF